MWKGLSKRKFAIEGDVVYHSGGVDNCIINPWFFRSGLWSTSEVFVGLDVSAW